MSEKKRKVFSGEFKAKVALEAIRNLKTVNVVPKRSRCIRPKWGRGSGSYRNRRRGCSRTSGGPSRWIRPPAPTGCIPRYRAAEDGVGLAEKKSGASP